MKDFDLQKEIEMLIGSKREDDYWDFKEKHHSNKANLIHDILCMANNRADSDAFIVYGIADSNYNVVGVENDENRRNQQNIIDILKSKKFISGIRPRIEMRTFKIENHEVDVLTIKNSTDTPYFLTENFKDSGRIVYAHHIYTRVGDTNTDIDKSADINNIEYLWKKRFLLNRSPFEQIIKRLENKKEWKRYEDTYFNIYNPEFTITLEEDDKNLTPEFYSYAMMNETTLFQILNVNYFGTKLFTRQAVALDGGRYLTPIPEWGFLHFGKNKLRPDFALKYFIKKDPVYKLNVFLYNEDDGEEQCARDRLFEVVLLFVDNTEHEMFMEYVHLNHNDLLEKIETFGDDYSWIESENKIKDRQRLKTGQALKLMLNEYRTKVAKESL